MQLSRKADRDLARALGLCTRCGSPLPEAPKYRRCEPCRRKHQLLSMAEASRRRKARRDAGLCIMCDTPSPHSYRCRSCADDFNEYQRMRLHRIREGTWKK